jgi:hypothetical protein
VLCVLSPLPFLLLLPSFLPSLCCACCSSYASSSFRFNPVLNKRTHS